ncbi:MAG TPA: (2Fe-2S)-binding protein [Herbaspirillum sp.]|jgi:nicotinate dehydrogenase subunit A
MSEGNPGNAIKAAAPIAVTVNGVQHALAVDGKAPLLDILRDTLKLKGSRFGCGGNQCGACYVLVDGAPVASCDTPMWAVARKAVITVEGLGDAASPHPLQQAFIDEQAAQCGYCIAGILISAAALLARCPRPTEADVRNALDRHLCRCGTHNRIVRAVLAAAAAMTADSEAAS